MIILAVLLLALGYVLGIAPLVNIGWVCLIVGLVLLALGIAGYPAGGRIWY